MPPLPQDTKGISTLTGHASQGSPRGVPILISGVHPRGVNDGPFDQDQLKRANHSTMTAPGSTPAKCDTLNTVRRRLPDGLTIFFFFLMLFRTFLFASIALGAFAPAAVEARSACGYASHYGHGDGFHGRIAANGSRFNAYAKTVAHPSLPFGTRVRIVDPTTGKSVLATTTDRGPFVPGRVLDLSYATFAAIAPPSKGVVRVCYRTM